MHKPTLVDSDVSAVASAVTSQRGDDASGPLPPGWEEEVYAGVEMLEALETGVWARCFAPSWKDARYYRTLQESFATQFAQRYLVLRGPDGVVEAVQPFFLVDQDLTVSLSGWLRCALRPVRRWTQARLLMVGCIVGEAHTGQAGQADPPTGLSGTLALALADALERYAAGQGVSLVLFKDFPRNARPGLRALTANGRYTRLPSLPGVRLALDFASWEEYMQTRLGRATRKSLRRKLRATDALATPLTLEVKPCLTAEEAVVLHALYAQVARRGDQHFEVFDAAYFLRLGERLPEHTRFFIWRQAGRPVAFAFCTVDGDTLYDQDLGLDEAAAATAALYHVTFRDLVNWALAQGLRWYQSTPFNYDPKLHLRMKLVPLDLYAHHRHPWANWLLRRFAPLAAPTRQHPLLHQFPNADLL